MTSFLTASHGCLGFLSYIHLLFDFFSTHISPPHFPSQPSTLFSPLTFSLRRAWVFSYAMLHFKQSLFLVLLHLFSFLQVPSPSSSTLLMTHTCIYLFYIFLLMASGRYCSLLCKSSHRIFTLDLFFLFFYIPFATGSYSGFAILFHSSLVVAQVVVLWYFSLFRRVCVTRSFAFSLMVVVEVGGLSLSCCSFSIHQQQVGNAIR